MPTEQEQGFNPNNLESLLAKAESKFSTCFEQIKIGDLSLDILQLKDMEAYVEDLADKTGYAESLELPYWAKIWPTSILLAHYLLKIPFNNKVRVLEIGSGLGLCGLVAASRGFQVTISDNHPDALLFAKTNLIKNNLTSQAKVEKIDFTSELLDTEYDFILGSEVLYHEQTYAPLVNFLLKHLKKNPQAEAILAKNYHLSAAKFFDLASQKFRILEKHIGYREKEGQTKGERHLATIYRLKPKS